MLGELVYKDWTGLNKANTNFLPHTLADVDTTNSDNTHVAVIQATNTTGEWVGVVYDQSKLDASGNPVTGSAVALRSHGIAYVTCSAAINPGQYVKVSNTSGQVAAATQTAGGAQPAAVVGRCLNKTTASGDLALILLLPGARY